MQGPAQAAQSAPHSPTCVCPRYRRRLREHCIDFTFCGAWQREAIAPLMLAA